MPTLVQVPTEEPRCHNSESSSDSSLDDTTLDMGGEELLDRPSIEARRGANEASLQDASVNLLETLSHHSFSSNDDSSVSSRSSNQSNENDSNNKATQKIAHQRDAKSSYSQTCANNGNHTNGEECYKSTLINNRENLSQVRSEGRFQDKSLASDDQEQNSTSRIYLNETTMLSESTCSPVLQKESSAKVPFETIQPSRSNEDRHKHSLSNIKDLERSHYSNKSTTPLSANKSKQQSETKSMKNNTVGVPNRKPLGLDWENKVECEAFRSKFGKMVNDFERQNHVKLCEYRTLTTDNQRKEQERVINLLDRLRIRDAGLEKQRKSSDTPTSTTKGEHPSFCAQDESMTRIDDSALFCEDGGLSLTDSTNKTETIAVFASKKTNNRNEYANATKFRQSELSSVLLSPIPGTSPKDLKLHENSVRFTAPSPKPNDGGSNASFGGCGQDDSTMSQDSVEITRAASSPPSNHSPLYQSPALERRKQENASKRLASTSGKRGFDKFRTKLNVSSSPETGDERMSSPSHQPWTSPEGSISPLLADGTERQSHPLLASQSPMRESHRQKPYERSEERSPESQGSVHSDDLYERYGHDESIDSVDVTMIRDRQKGRQLLRDIPANVALRDGVPFHYNPLHIKRSKRTKRRDRATKSYPRHDVVDFNDPLGPYIGEEGEDMYQVFEWLLQRDQTVGAHSTSGKGRRRDDGCGFDSKGIVFSLDQSQIVNISMKLLLAAEDTASDSYVDGSCLVGQTLILVRAKEDIETWERALREHTPFSVINHAALQCRDRKRSATATRCATFDVVLSTFDAVKAPDVTTQIDDNGYAVSRQGAESQADGWMIKRSGPASGSQHPSSEAVQCKQLSVLHRVNWRRIIFVDDLGRKCFLAKLGTARAFAAKALNGSSRFIFFTKTEDDLQFSAFETLAKSDRRAIQSVASVLRLHLDKEDEEDDTILDVIIDREQGM